MQFHNSSYPLIRLWQFADGFRGKIILATLCSVLNKIFDLAPPILIGVAIDVLVDGQTSFLAQMGYVDARLQLWLLAGLTVVVWGLESFFQYAYDILWRNLAQDIQHAARMDAYRHVQKLEMGYFEDRSTGGLMSVLNDDVNQLERFLDVGANEIIGLIVTILFVVIWFFALSPQVAWISLLPVPIIVWGSLRFQRQLAPRYAEVREEVGLLNGQLANNLNGIATIKSFTAEEHEIGRMTDHSLGYKRANQKAIRYSALFVPLIRMAVMAGFIAILVWGGYLVLNGELKAGAYSSMVYMIQRLLWPLTRLGSILDLYQRAMASTKRVFALLDTPIERNTGQQALSKPKGEIVFENVSFQYKNGVSVLRDLSLTIPAGQTIALVGSTGSGKSTLIKLLLRFYDVTSGRILLDGQELDSLQLSSLRQAIGLVSQDVYLFHGTAKENIRYGTFSADDSAMIKAAKVGEAHDFITNLPQGYDTLVGERGQKLSGGQRQRLSIARAVLKNPPILVLDEATSSVDNETEAAIQRSMETIAIGRTTIIIAHRLSTVRNADMIYVLEEGRIVEQGRHDQLVAQNGQYAELWRIQTGLRPNETKPAS